MATSSQRIDELLDVGNHSEAREVLSRCGLDHTDMIVQASDSTLIYYIGGYVAICRPALRHVGLMQLGAPKSCPPLLSLLSSYWE